MIIIQGTVRVSEADKQKFHASAATMIAATRAEPGCLGYSYAECVLEPGLIHIVERWKDQAALDAHMATPHMAALSAALAGLSLRDLKIIAFDASNERVLAGG